jgi:hypothetical protein
LLRTVRNPEQILPRGYFFFSAVARCDPMGEASSAEPDFLAVLENPLAPNPGQVAGFPAADFEAKIIYDITY